jgi:RNA polymerase sigma-70 factor (ECF subfamily)
MDSRKGRSATPFDTDRALVNRFRQGDVDAFHDLVQAHQGQAFRMAFLWTGDRGRAEDVVQEAFWKAWRRRAHLRDSARFSAWFLRILVNTYRDARRAQGRAVLGIPWGLVVESGGQTPGPEETALEADERQLVIRALAALGPEDRLVLTLRYLQGLAVTEVAAILGRPPNTVASRSFRAIKQLRKVLRDMEEVSAGESKSLP